MLDFLVLEKPLGSKFKYLNQVIWQNSRSSFRLCSTSRSRITNLKHQENNLPTHPSKNSLAGDEKFCEQGTFTSLVILGLDFVSWICIKNLQTFLDLLLSGAKDEHFSCCLSSWWLGLRNSGIYLPVKQK